MMLMVIMDTSLDYFQSAAQDPVILCFSASNDKNLSCFVQNFIVHFKPKSMK